MVYDKIKKLADEKGISIYALEKKAGLPNGSIGKWRESSPTLKSLEAVANALEVSVGSLTETKL